MGRIGLVTTAIGILSTSFVFGQADDNPCVNAPLITVGTTCNSFTVTISNSDSYSQNAANFGTPSCGGLGNEADVWYAFQAPAGGEVAIQTSAGTITDAVMEAYSSDCAGTFASLGCSDDANGLMPELSLNGLTPGTTYFIRLWEYNNGTGDFEICVVDTNPGGGGTGSPNDSDPCSNAIALPVNTNCVNSLVTIDPNDTYASDATNFGTPSCGATSAPDVWFSFVATVTGEVNITTSTSDLSITDAVMEVYSSDCAGTFTSLGCNDDPSTGTMPAISLNGLTPGNTYYIRLWDLSGGSGNFNICIEEDQSVPCTSGGNNADCGTADPFCTGNTYTYCNTTNTANYFAGNLPCSNVDELGASTPDDVFTSPNPAFYYLQVDTPGDLHIYMEQEDTLGNLIDIDFAMWGPFTSTSAACTSVNADSSLNLIDCSYSSAGTEDANIFGAASGDVYMIMMTNFANEVGSFTFSQTGGSGSTNCAIVLPVELGNFHLTTEDRSVVLNWSTQSELNNDYFSIERRIGGGLFEEIATIDGMGTTTDATTYQFTDIAPSLIEPNYYRLKQVDQNGDFTYTIVKSASFDLKDFTVYPNPNSGAFFVNTHGKENVYIQLLNLSGQVVQEQHVLKAESATRVDCSTVEKGAYILRVVQNAATVHQQIIVHE